MSELLAGRADTMAAMDSFLITVDGAEHDVSTGTVRRLLDTSARFWLDLAGVDKSTADGLLLGTFGFHQLAVEDAEHFGQRPKLEDYDDFTLMVVYGAAGSGELVEVHCFYTENYFRDLDDHLIRISDLVDSYRDLMSGVLDTHLSTVSNRLNVVMKQLTIIATIFLPLSFLTGFFGQNFAWMVTRITSLPVFLGAGIGLEVGVVVALVVAFRRRGWLSADGTVPPARPAD